jgi:sugar lactone lactonase YvrE
VRGHEPAAALEPPARAAARAGQRGFRGVTASGNVHVADNSTIRKVTPAGVVTTLAGTAGEWGSADGTGAAARFANPTGVAVDASRTVYVADFGTSTIRKVTAAGVVTTLAGAAGQYGSADGTGAAARFGNRYHGVDRWYEAGPSSVAVDASGTVYVADTLNGTIRKVTAAGVVTTLAGTAGPYGSADGTGAAARFNCPQGVAVSASGGTGYIVLPAAVLRWSGLP